MFCISPSEIEETWWNGETEKDESSRKSCRSLRDASEEVKK